MVFSQITPALLQDAYGMLVGNYDNTDLSRVLSTLHTLEVPAVGADCSGNPDHAKYPLDAQGFCVGLSLLDNPMAVRTVFDEFGFVVVDTKIPSETCEGLIARALEVVELLFSDSEGWNFERGCQSPWWKLAVSDGAGVPFYSRGFLEFYHDATWADIRQDPMLYLLWVTLWGRADIWTSFDRLGVKPPHCVEGAALSLHVDQNPRLDSDFCSLQGVLALRDCSINLGTTVVVHSSRARFHEWAEYASPEVGKHYIQLDQVLELREHAQPLPLRAGHILVWDSRLVHANTPNQTDDETRWVALVASGIAVNENRTLVKERLRSMQEASGWNNRAALLYASKRPRFYNPKRLTSLRRPEVFSPLGRLLYGIRSYREVFS
jgi:hypothetical protein